MEVIGEAVAAEEEATIDSKTSVEDMEPDTELSEDPVEVGEEPATESS